MTLGERIKELRKAKGIKQSELAAKLNKSTRLIQKYENNEVSPPIDTIEALATILGTTPFKLMDWEKIINEEQIRKDLYFIEYLEKINYLIEWDSVPTGYEINPDGSKSAIEFDESPDAPCCTIIRDGISSVFTNQQFKDFQKEIEKSVEFNAYQYRSKK